MTPLVLRAGPYMSPAGQARERTALFAAFLFPLFLLSTGSAAWLISPLSAGTAALLRDRSRLFPALLGALAALPFLPPEIYLVHGGGSLWARFSIFLAMGLAAALGALRPSLVRHQFLPAAAAGLIAAIALAHLGASHFAPEGLGLAGLGETPLGQSAPGKSFFSLAALSPAAFRAVGAASLLLAWLAVVLGARILNAGEFGAREFGTKRFGTKGFEAGGREIEGLGEKGASENGLGENEIGDSGRKPPSPRESAEFGAGDLKAGAFAALESPERDHGDLPRLPTRIVSPRRVLIWALWLLAALCAARSRPLDFAWLWWPLAMSAFWREGQKPRPSFGRSAGATDSSQPGSNQDSSERADSNHGSSVQGDDNKTEINQTPAAQARHGKAGHGQAGHGQADSGQGGFRADLLVSIIGLAALSAGAVADNRLNALFPAGAIFLLAGEIARALSLAKIGRQMGRISPSREISAFRSNPSLTAFRLCARPPAVKAIAKYKGPMSCKLAAAFDGGPFECKEACLGLGDCLRACPAKAIREDARNSSQKAQKTGRNIAQDNSRNTSQEFSPGASPKTSRSSIPNLPPPIDSQACLGCGECAKACPKGLMILAPREAMGLVACRGTAFMKAMDLLCGAGCLGCGRCRKACPVGAISKRDHQAPPRVDLMACASGRKSCDEACRKSCPRKLPGSPKRE